MFEAREKVCVSAHRGGRNHGIENTLTAMRNAMAMGVDMIETDVRMTRDGYLVLMHDDPRQIAMALRISRKCVSIVYQNIVFAIAVKLLSLVLVAVGIGGMGLAIFADVGVMVLAVLNAIRMLVHR